MLPRIDRFKVQYFGHANIGLHDRAMALKAGPFQILADPVVAGKFEQDLGRLIDDLDVAILCAVIDKLEYRNRYGITRPVDEHLPKDLYLMALDFVLERFVKFLEERTPARLWCI